MANKQAISASAENEADWENATEENEDPFATDFFSQTGTVTITAEEVSDVVEIEPELMAALLPPSIKLWSDELPQVSVDEIRKQLILTHAPADLTDKICQIVTSTLSQVLLQNSDNVQCQLLAGLETTVHQEATAAAAEQAVLINFSVEPNQTNAFLVVEAASAVALVAKSLGAENALLKERRLLSATEIAVLEFFALNCLRHLNDYLQQPLFRLRSAAQEFTVENDQRCLLYNVQLNIGGESEIIKLLLPFDFLANLQNNALFPKKQARNGKNEYAAVVSRVKSAVILGSTVIEASDLAVLERDDVILIERPLVRWQSNNLVGSGQIRLAGEPEAVLFGDLNSSDETVRVAISDINQKSKIYPPKRLRMPDEQNEFSNDNLSSLASEEFDQVSDNNEGIGLALEKIIVNLTVELASRRLSLDELAQLRVGQTLELGTRPTDPVELVTDGRTVAVGELVDVEGNLGVRLTRVLL